MRTLSWPAFLGAAALLLGSPAEAQTTTEVLRVSNSGRDNGSARLIFAYWDFMQGFTTGPNASGWKLASIALNLTQVPNSGSGLRAWVLSATGNGSPGTSTVCDLDNPSPLTTGYPKFTAKVTATGCVLQEKTQYFVALTYTGSGDRPYWRLTPSNGESTRSEGWSINDRAHARPSGGSNNHYSESSQKVRIYVFNNAPASADRMVSIDEDTAYTFGVSDFAFTDIDRDTLTHVEITSLPGTNEGKLAFDGADVTNTARLKEVTKAHLNAGKLKYTPPLNANGVDFTTFNFKVSDGFDVSANAYSMKMNVMAVDDQPAVSGNETPDYEENGTAAVSGYLATDAEGATIAWSLSGPDSDDFSIDSGSGDLTFKSAPDYENPADTNGDNEYLVTVEASDGALTGTLDVTVTVTDAPVISGPTATSYIEDGTEAVGTYTAGGSVTWDLSGPDSDEFSIDSGGILSFNASPDFESPTDANKDNMYTVTVEATDGGETGALDVAVTVTANDPPVVSGSASPDYEENGTAAVGSYLATDPQGDAITWSLTGEDRSAFNISDGVLSFINSPDYDVPADADSNNIYEVTVEAFDGTVTGTLDVTVTVTANADLSALSIPELTLNEPFASATTRYTATVTHSVSHVTVTATPADSSATVMMTVDGTEVNDGTVPLKAGAVTTIRVAVAHGNVHKIHTIEIRRSAPARGKRGASATTSVAEGEDEVRPTVTMQMGAPAPVGGAFEVTIAFSEEVTGFEPGEMRVTNGTIMDFNQVSPSEYRAMIEPALAGPPVRVEIPEDVVEDGGGNGNEAAAPFIMETAAEVSYAGESYTAAEGGAAVMVTVKLSLAADRWLAVPIRVTRPETTEVGDYRVEGLEGWDAEVGRGTLTFGAGETERTWGIAANHDRDGDDETVELGFGELPEIVMAGEPSVATVTLEDRGLVELEVRFAQAAYEVKEGRGVDIELSVSPAADRRVEVPLVVALQGGTTAEDYRGVPASMVFEEGESAGTISVEVLADEVSDSGEGIVLSFGALPEAVVAGDPSSTEVHFVQQRTAEQFSQTLEGMLAVMARSMGESAQRAIEGRFARYRQWSRLGSSGGAMEPRMPGTDEAVSGGAPTSGRSGPVSRGESSGFGGGGAAGAPGGGDSSAEPGTLQAAGRTLPAMEPSGDAARDPGAPGGSWARGSWAGKSWLRNILLGSLGRLARSDQIASGASAGSGIDRSRNGYGERGLRGVGGGERGSAGYSVLPSRAFRLSGASFEMPLGEGARETSWVPAFWGQGDVQQFDGDLGHLGMNYRGGLNAAHVGLDLYANERMLAGLSFMHSWGELDYTDDGVDGVMESGLNTVHPYLYWQPGARVSVWGIGGLGRGRLDVTEPGRTHDFGADFRMFAGGVRAALLRWGGNEWSVRADAFTTRLETGAAEDIAKVGGEAQRGRMMLEWVYDRQLSVGRSLSLKGEAGGRFDRGAADLGAGLETGFRLGYLDANQGLDVGVQGRVLLVHESDYRDWGVGVQASFDPGKKQRGFRASATTSWGRDGGGRTTLWDNADAVLQPAGMGVMGMGASYRMESEVAYAGLKAPGLPGRLTPYSRLRWTGHGRELAWGASWLLPARSQLALPGTFALEGLRRENTIGPSDLALLVRMSIPF